MNKTNKVKAGEKGSCLSHECKVCERELYTSAWWHSLIFVSILAVVVGGAMSLGIWLDNKAYYEPLCYSESIVYGHEMDNTVFQKDYYDCDDFEVAK